MDIIKTLLTYLKNKPLWYKAALLSTLALLLFLASMFASCATTSMAFKGKGQIEYYNNGKNSKITVSPENTEPIH